MSRSGGIFRWLRDHTGTCAVAGGALLIALVTLRPLGGSGGDGSVLLCLRCGAFGSVDVALNTLLFVPLGLGLALSGLKFRRAVLIAFVITLAIETIQFALISGRFASLSDVLANAGGSAIGFMLGVHWRDVAMPSRRVAAIACLVTTTAWGGSRLLTMWLLEPSLPDTLWYVQVAPTGVYPGAFRGEVLAASIAGAGVTVGPDRELSARVRTAGASIAATVTSAAPTPFLSSVVSVFDGRRREVLLLGQEGADARFRLRLRAADEKFRVPSLRLPGAFTQLPGTRLLVSGSFRAGELSLVVAEATFRKTTSLRLGPGLGWAFMLPFDAGLSPQLSEIASASVAALVCLLIGFFADRSFRARPANSFAFGFGLATVGLLTPLSAFPGAGPRGAELLASALGVLTGVLLARSVFGRSDGSHQSP